MRVYGKKYWQSAAATLCLMWWVMLGPLFTTGVTVYMLFTKYFWVSALIFGWSFLDNSQNRGGRRFRPFRRLPLFRWWRDYFPISLVKTAELSADNNYILGYHPHGLVGTGTVSTFATEALNISATFPGLVFHQLTTRLAYVFPIYREWWLSLGASNVSAENMKHITSRGPGNAMVVVIGGAAEIMESRPGVSRLVLRDRKGYAKMALITGSHLVPVYGFGENDIYVPFFSNPVGSTARKVQEWIKTVTKGLPAGALFYGPSKILGPLLPLPRPVTVVVGEPIAVSQDPSPSQAAVTELHEKYRKALQDLFERHKERYGCEDVTLELV